MIENTIQLVHDYNSETSNDMLGEGNSHITEIMVLKPVYTASVGPAVLGLRKLGACAAVSLGRLTLVEGGAVGWVVSVMTQDLFFCLL